MYKIIVLFIFAFLCGTLGWSEGSPEPGIECHFYQGLEEPQAAAENVVADVHRILRTLRLQEFQSLVTKELPKFYQSHNVIQFVGDYKNINHSKAKELETAVQNIETLEPEDRYYVLKNLRQIDQLSFADFIHEIKALDCRN